MQLWRKELAYMQVTLIDSPDNPVDRIARIASICYGKTEARDPGALVRKLYESGHHSVFEHVSFTYKIEGISRVCAQQLTRHRHMSYTMRSQRYTVEDERSYITPDSLWEVMDPDDTLDDAFDVYTDLVYVGVPKEDARYMLPQATATDLYLTCNLRSLIHLANERLCVKAQWEIRELVKSMCEQVGPELQYMLVKRCQSGLHICRGCE